ncbi:TPA: DUF2184 domain-containing protein [Escherichia coli]|nr:DUF2184 domain-containing protein [Escherichia coli]HEI0663038.1 DUF2184 domain-containing protein [Escherichia coli]
MMHIVTVNDSQTGQSYQYDADMVINNADSGIAFYISQLAVLDPKIYDVKYRNIIFPEVVPVDTSMPEWIDNVNYISYDAVTMGKFIAANGKDLPQSDIDANISSVPVGYAGNSYGYTLEELRKSQQMRLPLDVTKARVAYRGAQEHMQRVAWFGDASRGMTGMFNNLNIPLDNSTVNWATATGQEMVNDMNSLLIKVWSTSANVHVPDTLLLPSDKYAIASSKRMDTGTDTTVMEFFKRNNLFRDITGQEIEVRPILELQTANTAGTGPRMMAYEKTPDNLVMYNPIPWRPLAPQPNGLRIEVSAEYKISGVEFRYPGSAAYRDML